jgi:hypothetical protein
MAARDMGNVTLAESLALTALVVQKDPGRRSRYTVRWLDSIVKTEANPQCQLPVEERRKLMLEALNALHEA